MNADTFRHFYDYHFAENRKTWDRYVLPLTHEQFTQEVDYSHGFARDQIVRLASVEDALHEDDFEGWAQLTAELPDIQWVGDDLCVTNPERLRKGIEMGAANTVLWKVNQIGTLTEALEVAEMAYRHGYGVQVSERSGETEDPIIADLTVALSTGQIKTGTPVRGERTSKYNQLLRIEEELGDQTVYAGRNFRWSG